MTGQDSGGLRRRRAAMAGAAVLVVLVGGGAVAHAVRGGGDASAGPVVSAHSTSAAAATASPAATPARGVPSPPATTTPRAPATSRPPSPSRPATPRVTPSTTATAGGSDDTTDAVDTARLSPTLGRALTAATVAAREDGVRIRVTSGYRTAAHQQELYEQAIRTYGSARLARRWVLPPAESAHVRGQAVDVGPRSAAAWLQAHGNTWGLCRRYDNEWWHFEVATAPGTSCPARVPHA